MNTVYSFFAADGSLLYVGCSKSPVQRIGNHRSKAWWPQVVRAEFEHFDSVEDALDRERVLISTLHPHYNSRSKTATPADPLGVQTSERKMRARWRQEQDAEADVVRKRAIQRGLVPLELAVKSGLSLAAAENFLLGRTRPQGPTLAAVKSILDEEAAA